MSTKYELGENVPNEVIADRLDVLAGAVVARMRGDSSIMDREFTCRIPAELDRDPDLILSEAAKRLREFDGVIEEIHRLRALEDSYDTQDSVLSELLLGLNKLCGT